MYFATIFNLATASAAPAVSSAGGYLHLPVSRRHLLRADGESDPLNNLWRRADSDLDVTMANNNTFYSIEFELGTPPQQLSLLLDTGSSDLWLLNEDACDGVEDCVTASVFDNSTSKTFKSNDTLFVAKYGDGTGAVGVWAQDTLKLGSEEIPDFNFALANLTTSKQGVAGIGLAVGETPYILEEIAAPYANLPLQMKQQGLIQQVAYSLWLNELSSDAGSVLFGGIDYSKFSTDLYTMPLVKTGNDTVTNLAVELTGLSIYDSKGNEQPFASCNIPAVLDSGSTISALPAWLLAPFYNSIGVQEYSEGVYVVECDLLNSKNGGLGIQLGGVDITVGFSDLFVKALRVRKTGKEYCIPGFLITDDIPIIGDNILRTLYVVYDLENLEVGIAVAQTGKEATSTSSIQALSTGIPGKQATDGSSLGTVYATTSITLLGLDGAQPSASDVRSATRETLNTAHASSTLTGFRHGSMSVPASVTQSYVIGAKSGAQSTKGTTAADSSRKSTNAAVAQQSTKPASSGDSRDKKTSASSSDIQAKKTSASSGGSRDKTTSSAGAAVTRANTLLTALAGVLLALL